MNKIETYLADNGYNTCRKSIDSYIDEWLEWYQGDVEKFHKYNIYNGINIVGRKRKTLNMAKKVCEDWANLILNEKVSIKTNSNFDSVLTEIFERNNFNVRANQLIELSFALGTGAFVEYLGENKEVVIDYIRAEMIYPLSWDNGDITECAFGSYRVIDGKEFIYLQIHKLENDVYVIENKLIDSNSGKEVDLNDDTIPIVNTGSKSPLFQIITPNIVNNIDLDNPLGVSCYANSLDVLKGIDLIYDSYINEYSLGKKRIIVPISMAKIQMQEEGIVTPVFDTNDTEFYALPGDREENNQITEINMTIRAADHEAGLQRNLDLLSTKVGLGNNRYQFNADGVKTATEVISEKSDLFQNLKKHEIVIKATLEGLVRSVAFLYGNNENLNISIDFDDSIIEDTNATIDRNIKLISSGLRSKITAIMEINKCSEEEAQKELEKIAKESQVNGDNIDWANMDFDNKNEDEEKQGDEE